MRSQGSGEECLQEQSLKICGQFLKQSMPDMLDIRSLQNIAVICFGEHCRRCRSVLPGRIPLKQSKPLSVLIGRMTSIAVRSECRSRVEPMILATKETHVFPILLYLGLYYYSFSLFPFPSFLQMISVFLSRSLRMILVLFVSSPTSIPDVIIKPKGLIYLNFAGFVHIRFRPNHIL